MSNYTLGYNDVSKMADYDVDYDPDTGQGLDVVAGGQMLKNDYLSAQMMTINRHPFTLKITLPESTFPSVPDVQVLGVCNHNLRQASTLIWHVYPDGFDQPGSLVLYLAVFIDFAQSINQSNCNALSAPVQSRYWTLTVHSSYIIGEPEYPVKIGQLFMGQLFNPGENMQYGINFGIDTQSTLVNTSDAGIDDIPRTITKRTAVFSHTLMPDSVAVDWMALQLQQGLHKNYLFEYNPDATVQGLRTFLARSESIQAASHDNNNANSFSFKLKEVI